MVLSCTIIVVTYFFGRFCEARFKSRFGFNQFLWQPFDNRLCMVIARRNINLLLLSAGALFGGIPLAFHSIAVWSVISLGAQAIRYRQALDASGRDEDISNWMEGSLAGPGGNKLRFQQHRQGQ